MAGDSPVREYNLKVALEEIEIKIKALEQIKGDMYAKFSEVLRIRKPEEEKKIPTATGHFSALTSTLRSFQDRLYKLIEDFSDLRDNADL